MDNYIFGIKKEDFLNKNIIKIIDGIAGAGKSSIIDNFLKNNNINYLRTTSTNQLKIDAAKRYDIECKTICSALFNNKNGFFYDEFKEVEQNTIVIDEILQTSVKVLEWVQLNIEKVNIIITCDSKQLLSQEGESEIKNKFLELCNSNNVIYVNIEKTKRPVNEETAKVYKKYYELADSDNIYTYNYLINNFKSFNFEDINFSNKNAYICHTKEIEEYIYIYFNLSTNDEVERVPKGYLASKQPKNLKNYPLFSQLRAEKNKSLKYCQAKNVACPTRFQGSEVADGNKLYYIIEKNSKIIARELYTVITRCKNINDFYIVVVDFEKTKKLKSFNNKPIKKEIYASMEWFEDVKEPFLLDNNIINNLFSNRFKDTSKYTYNRDVIYLKNKTQQPLFVSNNYIKYDNNNSKKPTIKTMIKKEASLNLSYINDMYLELEKYGIDKIRKPIIKNENTKEGKFQIDICGAYPYFLKFDFLPCDGEFSNEYNKDNLNYYIYNGEFLTDKSIITENLKNYIEDNSLGVCEFVFSLPKQYGSKTGDDVFELYHRSKEKKEETKKNMKWGILEKHFLKLNYNEDAYIIKEDCTYEIFMATIYSNLTYNMLLLNDIIEGNFIQVDAIYFDNLNDLDELNKKIINIIPKNIEYRIINNEDKNIIFKNYEDLMTEKEYLLKRKRDKAREKYNNMTEEEHEELNRKSRNKYNNIK